MKKIFIPFFLWTAIIYIFAYLSYSPASFDYSYESTSIIKENLPYLRHLLNFDGGHYQNISRFGYFRKFLTAFFPLYPILIHIFSFLFISHVVSALLISLVSLSFSFYLITRIYKKPAAGLLLIFYPLSFFFLAGYTESIFLLLSLLSWHLFRQKKYLFSAIFGFFASLARSYGIILFLPLLLEYFLSKDKKYRFRLSAYKKILPMLLIPLGLITYMSFLFIKYQDPLSFVHVQRLWNRGAVVTPFQTVYRYFKILTTVSMKVFQYWIAVLELLSLLIALLASYYFYRSKQFSYSLYLFLGSIIPAFTGTLLSLPRFIMVLFPLYFIKIPPKIRPFLYTAGFALQLVLLVNFLTGRFVA